MSIRSMTGFARIRKTGEPGEVVVSVKSVNHRGLDMHFHMPPELDCFENALRAAIKAKVGRGHVQVQVRYTGAASEATAALNRPLLEAYLAAFKEAGSALAWNGQPDLNVALRIPGMFQSSSDEPDAAVESLLVSALDDALDVFNRFREREGAQLVAELENRNRQVREHVAEMEQARSRAIPAFQARLNERLGQLLKDANLEPQRLAQEAAFLTDRTDITEELTRLRVHAQELDRLLASGSEVGKKLDFLLQEMQREANTILAKSAGAGELGLPLTALGLKVKAEIEKIREQSLNLE